MKSFWLVLVFAVVMVNGQETKPKSASDAEKTTHVIKPADRGVERTVVVINQPASEWQEDDHTTKSPSYLHRLLSPENLPNIALVIVAAITGAYIAIQARETARTAKAAEDSVKVITSKERARLVMELPKTSLFAILKEHEIGFPYYDLQLPIINHGQTKAFNVRGEARIQFSSREMQPDVIRDSSKRLQVSINLPSIIRPDEIHTLGVFLILEQVTRDALEDGTAVFNILGSISYNDIFGNSQITPFWYRWAVDFINPSGEYPDMEKIDAWELGGEEADNRAS